LPDIPAGADLPWRLAQPCGKLPAATKAVDVGRSSSQGGCCQWTNAWYGLQRLHLRILLA